MITRIAATLWLLLSLSLSPVFAIATPSGLTSDDVTTVSATLSWDEVDNAAAYSIYYWVDSTTLSEKDLVETSPYTLVGLQNNTVYYAAVYMVSNHNVF